MRIISKKMISAALVTMSISSIESEACTNVIVTRGASADGSNMISYSADSHYLYGELYYAPAGIWEEGSMREIREWDTGRFIGYIPQVSRTYQRVGNMNEHQLIIAETTYGGRPELEDQIGIMDYGSLIYVTLERARTAREAIEIIVDLANTYGYCSGGESFSIADTDEAWVMDLIGKGNGKGIVWVARRVPDGYICAHANQARISTFPLDDPENCLYAPDVITFAREKGYFSGEDKDFSFCDAYAPLDFSGMRGCEARVWSAYNILCDGKFTFCNEKGKVVTKDAYDFIDYAMGWDKKVRMPLFVKPADLIDVKELADVMRDHYEGTPMDMTEDIGAGGNALPYRWRPMGFEYNGKSYVNERAIATQQTGFWFIGQSRAWMPDEIGGINWFGCDDAATSYLTPIYASTYEIPECFREGNGSLLEYSPTSAFWMTNRVANACYKAYNIMFPTVDAEIDAWELSMMEAVEKADKEALELYRAADSAPQKKIRRNDKARKTVDKFAGVRRYLTEFSVNNAQTIFDKWVALEQLLLVKFIDGNVKMQNEDGSFIRSEHSDGIPGKIQQPGYTEKWKEYVAKDYGYILIEK